MAIGISDEEKQRLKASGAKVSRKLQVREKSPDAAHNNAVAHAVSQSNNNLARMFETHVERFDAIIEAILAENRELRAQLLAVQQGQVELQRAFEALRDRPVRLKPRELANGLLEVDVVPLKVKEPVRH